MRHLAIALGLAGALAAPPLRADGPDDRPPLEPQDGDRVVLVGDALIERMQQDGHLEALLTAAHPDKTITFRNLGRSGDTVFGEARAGFGTPEDGFKALVAQVEATEPTVLIVGYGANESWDGEAGLPRFREGYERLLDELEATGAREIVLLSPIPQARPGGIQPFGGFPHNRDVRRYAEEIGRIARTRGHRFADLDSAIGEYPRRSLSDIEAGKTPTRSLRHVGYASDGIHLDEGGHKSLASWLADCVFGVPRGTPHAEVTVGDEVSIKASNCIVGDVVASPEGLRFTLTRSTPIDPQLARPSLGQGRIRVAGLPEGRYRVECDGRPLPEGHADVAGFQVSSLGVLYDTEDRRSSPTGIMSVPGSFLPDVGPDLEQFEALRRAIVAKDRLYFHRYRPQNETYLFGFRKHEQGDNAAEVEQFDRLVAEAEAEIARLKVSRSHVYELERIEEDDDR